MSKAFDWLDWHDAPDPPKPRPLYNRPLAYVDIETTGLNRNRHTIIDFAIIREDTGAYETKIKPNAYDLKNASPEAIKSTGYNDEEWADAPELKDVVPEIARQLTGVALVGHNAHDFDRPFLRRVLGSFGFEDWVSSVYIDTLIMSRALFDLPKNNLQAVCAHLGIEPEGVHRAMGGARRVQLICQAIKERLR